MNVMIPESDEVQRHRAAVERETEFRLLESRVRRRLRAVYLVLHKSRGQKQTQLFGRYWITDWHDVMPIQRHVELPALARRLHIYFDDLASIR